MFLSAFYIFTAWLVHVPYRINPLYTLPDFVSAFAYVLRSVLPIAVNPISVLVTFVYSTGFPLLAYLYVRRQFVVEGKPAIR
ncbi:MAG TPA: hypothetical protein VF490_09985 [Chryseosolibacter sp.]